MEITAKEKHVVRREEVVKRSGVSGRALHMMCEQMTTA